MALNQLNGKKTRSQEENRQRPMYPHFRKGFSQHIYENGHHVYLLVVQNPQLYGQPQSLEWLLYKG